MIYVHFYIVMKLYTVLLLFDIIFLLLQIGVFDLLCYEVIIVQYILVVNGYIN